jgi:hypothetical protein
VPNREQLTAISILSTVAIACSVAADGKVNAWLIPAVMFWVGTALLTIHSIRSNRRDIVAKIDGSPAFLVESKDFKLAQFQYDSKLVFVNHSDSAGKGKPITLELRRRILFWSFCVESWKSPLFRIRYKDIWLGDESIPVPAKSDTTTCKVSVYEWTKKPRVFRRHYAVLKVDALGQNTQSVRIRVRLKSVDGDPDDHRL